MLPFEERLLAEVDVAERARATAERAARLYGVAVAVANATTEEETASTVLGEGVAALGATGGGILLADGDGLSVAGTVGYDATIVARLRHEALDAELPAAHAVRTGESVWLETVEERNERFPGLVGFEPRTIAMCAVPLVAGGRILGALRFSFEDRRLFDDDERQFLIALAAETAEALQRARLLQSERDARRRLEHERASLEKLAAVGEAMLRGGNLSAVLELATDAATQLSGAELGAFFYNAVDAAGESYMLYTLSGVSRAAFDGLPMPRNTAIFGPTFNGESTMRLDDVTADPRYGRSDPFRGMPSGHPPVRSPGRPGDAVGRPGRGRPLLRSPRSRPLHRGARATGGRRRRAGGRRDRDRPRPRRAGADRNDPPAEPAPARLPVVRGLDLGAAYAAADAGVGGDFYDVFPLGGDTWGVTMGDVHGRGAEAAALTAMARYTVRTAAILERSPGEVCRVVADAFATGEDVEQSCTLVFGKVATGPDGVLLTYANAGHPSPVVLRTGDLEVLPPTGPLLGVFAAPAYDERTVRLEPGDALVLYTDGISEARAGDEQFGDRQLADLLDTLRPRPSAEIADTVMDEARAFARGAADDAAVFVLKVR